MKLTQNIVKGYLTTLIGVATIIITLSLIYADKMDFIWNGVAGLSIGTILILAPQSIEKLFGKIVDKHAGTPAGVEEPFVNPNQQS